jgi:hypothetical protein
MMTAAFRARGIDRQIDIQSSLSATACAIAAKGAAVALHDPFAFLTGQCPGIVARRVRPKMPLSVSLLFSPEYPNSIVASRLVVELRAVAAEATRRLAAELSAKRAGRASA